MKAWIIGVAVAALAAGSAPSAAAGEEMKAAGRWQVAYKGTGDSDRIEAELVLKVDGEQVSGTWSNARNKITDLPVAGTLKDGRLSLDSAGGVSSPGWLTGQISGDQMTGKIVTKAGPVRDFNAMRLK